MRLPPLLPLLLLASCVESRPARELPPLIDEPTPLEVAMANVTGTPGLLRYPLLGPHNGGWDHHPLSFSCPPHTPAAPDNSDFNPAHHFGNDIFAPRGTPVVAAQPGRIVYAGWDPSGGNRVTVRDPLGWRCYYAHLETIAPTASVGHQVATGERLGAVGNSGNAAASSPHLHFSVYPADCYKCGIDPFPLLNLVDVTSCP